MRLPHVRFMTRGMLLTLVTAVAVLASIVSRQARYQGAIARSSVCQHHLAFLYRALRSYHDKYGRFPPAFVADKHGKPMHSWRVLVLETLGEPQAAEVYRAYKFDEPWNGPNNRKLVDRMPNFFACPNARGDAAGPNGLANYVVITGSDTVFRGAVSVSMSNIADIHSDTIVLAETLPGVTWLEPIDLESDVMSFEIDDASRPGIASRDVIGAGVVLVDGRVERLRNPAGPVRIKSMIAARLTGGDALH